MVTDVKRIVRKETGTLAAQLARIEEALKENKDMELDNEVMRKKSVKKGKGKLTKGGITLDILQKKMDTFEEAAGPQNLTR